MFLRPFVKADEKLAIRGQNFIKAYRLRSGVLPYHLGFAIQLDHRFGSKWMLNKLHHLGYSESYAETQNYNYCFLNDKNSMGFSDSSGTLNTTIEETDNQADAEVDIELENLSASAAVAENETRLHVQKHQIHCGQMVDHSFHSTSSTSLQRNGSFSTRCHPLTIHKAMVMNPRCQAVPEASLMDAELNLEKVTKLVRESNPPSR